LEQKCLGGRYVLQSLLGTGGFGAVFPAEWLTIKSREVATVLDQIEDNRVKANLMAATSVFGGILLAPELIRTILRSEIMKESAVYQENLREGKIKGKLEGRLEGKLETTLLLKKLGLMITEIAIMTRCSGSN
jgi:predicted transposase/invertase (TIGR01784 family)